MTGRQIILLLAVTIAIGIAWVSLWNSQYGWVVYVAAAMVCSLSAGILWEKQLTDRIQAKNRELVRQADVHREELTQAKKLSSEMRLEAAQALRDSEALYHSLVDHLPLSVLRKDRDGKYTFVNRRYLEFSNNNDSATIIGKTDFDVFPHDLATKYRAGDELVLSTGAMFEDTERYSKPDGEIRYIQVLKTPIRDAEQKIIGTQVMFWDVTARHRAEEAAERASRELERRNAELLDSEHNLQRQTNILMSVLNSIADGVVVADEQGRFVIWNPAADRIIGLGPMDKPTASWTHIYGLFRTDRVTPYPADELPLAKAIRGESTSDEELYVRNKSRPEGVILSVNGTPLTDPAGQIKGGVVSFRDVTQQRHAAEALRQSEMQARQIVETAFDPFISIDAEGRVIDWNTQASRTFGWSRQDVLGKPLAELVVPPQYREAHARGIGRYLATGEGPVLNSRIEITALHRDGHEFPVELTIWPVENSERRCFHAFVHDITRRKKNEAEIQSKNQDLETLLYVISHDLREPLRAIENFSRIVCERYADKLDEKGQDFLQRVMAGAKRLDRLIDDVLTLSRVQRTAQVDEAVDSGEIVADVLRHLEPRIRETHAVVNVADGLPAIRADRRWATQAVQNLVSNALKYTAEGEIPHVEIGGFKGPEGVGLMVQDRGLGVPPDCADRIFQLFQRAVSRNIEGTGAGLAIVKRVAERHGGRAWVRPREGGGSEFIITFGMGTTA